MRYQPKPYRSQSFAIRESIDAKETKENKENKENSNVLNVPLNKINRPKDLLVQIPLCQPKLEHRISESTTTPTTPLTINSLLRRDPMPEQLKKTYTQMIVKDYSLEIIEYLCAKSEPSRGILERHNISSNLRSKMVDWMIEVLSSYKMTEETFFRSVYIMDAYLKKRSQRLEVKDLHLIGVTAMFAAAKYEQIHPLKLNVIYDKIARKKFKRNEILEKESEIINTLDFKIENVSIYDVARQAVEQMQLPLEQHSLKYFHKIILYLSKMTLFNSELAQESPSLLGGAVIFIGLKTLEQVDPAAEPEGRLLSICSLLFLKEEELIEVSRRMLDLAKNFSKYFPSLNNLKKFNKFEYGID